MKLIRRVIYLQLIVFLLLPLSSASANNRIEIPEGPSGYFAVPDAVAGVENVHPLLILVHDWWGLDPYWTETAEKLKNNGFAVFAVDLYEGRLPQNPMDAYQLSEQVNEEKALRNLGRVIQFFEDYPSVNANRLGVIGWSRGATLALKLALKEPKRIHALGLYYGHGLTKEPVDLLRMPLIGFYGGQDKGVPKDQVDLFTIKLEELRKRFKIYSYPEAGHGFFHPASEAYDPQAVQDTWQKTVDFFKVNLA